MRINIKVTNLIMTEGMKNYVQEKMDMLDKYLGNTQVLNCDVEIGKTTNHHHKGDIFRAEVNLSLTGELLRVEKVEDDLYKAIDKVKEHLAQAIKKDKDKKK